MRAEGMRDTNRIRMTGSALWNWMALVISLALAAMSAPGQAVEKTAGPAPEAVAGQMARVKDVSTIEGIRDNQLVGYGLVVGLRGTGDSSQTVFPAQTLLSVLERMGITVPQTGANSAMNMQVKNMAGVFVVATMPPFSQPGFKGPLFQIESAIRNAAPS